MSEQVMQASSAQTLSISPQEAARPSALDRPVLARVGLTWESAAWALLFAVGAVARFYQLGVRAMSHDESLHTLYAYYLYNAGNYEHNPMMHGPFRFHITALMYFLFGDSDTTARLAPALAGIGVMAMALLFRRYIGRTGALAAGALVAISPSLLYHSRYIRDDIFISLFTMVWIYGTFRYLDARRESGELRRVRWLMLLVLGMAFAFVTMENSFIHGALIGAFMAVLALWQALRERVFIAVAAALLGAATGFWLLEAGQAVAGLAVAGLGMAVALGLLAVWLAGEPWQQLRRNDAADMAVLMATLVLPFLAPFGHLIFGWDAMAYATTTDLARSAGLVAVLGLASAALAYYWFSMRPASEQGEGTLTFGTWAQMMGVFWLIQVLFFTTFLTNTRNGLATGIVGSLGYWLAQHEVQRGGQPWYYYIMLSWLYEFLPLLLTVGGAVTALAWVRRSPSWDPVAAGDLPPALQAEALADPVRDRTLRQTRVHFVLFALWWSAGTWLAYSVAGEKMPWLLTHIALPMCIVGGGWVGRLVRETPWAEVRKSGAIWLLGAAPALLLLLAGLYANLPEGGRELSAVARVTPWLLALGIATALAVLAWRWTQAAGRVTAGRLVALGGAFLLLLFTIRFTYLLNYVNYDLVTEYLVYAHGSPDIKRALAEIDVLSERTVGARNIEIAYDDESSWPLSWYMRLYPNARFYGDTPNTDAMDAPVIIVGPKNYDKVHPYVTRDYVKRTYRLVWWPDQGYFGLTWERLVNTLRDPDRLKRIFDIVMYRRYHDEQNPTQERDLTQWPNRHDFEMWVRRDVAAQIWDLNVTPLVSVSSEQEALVRSRTVELAAAASYTGQFGDLPLLTPRTLALAPDGSRVIADTGNHRIVVLDVNGSLLRVFGSLCRLNEGAAGGCVDPDGDGPRQMGDGQFNEPWGVAVDNSGQIYVADTWNGRIQVFEPDGTFVRAWGYFNTTNGELGDPLALFGPRGLAIDASGNLLVADTGNKRILRYTADGELLQQTGGGGVDLGRFEEPTDVAVDPRDGSVFVADAWNRRIQKLDSNLQPLAEWPVPSWTSQNLYHKPYLAVTATGDVYATDPANFRVLVYNSAGGLKAAFGSYGVEMNRFGLPVGAAWDPQTHSVLVADSDNHRIQVFPMLP